MKLFVATILLASVLFVKSAWQKPAFCGSYDCPEYTVAETGSGYEKRHYVTATWITTSAAGNYEQASQTTYTKLRDYLNKNNKEGKTIPMSVPVVTMMFPTTGQNVAQNFTTFFLIAPSAGKAPQPNDPSIVIKEVPPKYMYARQIHGKVSSVAEWVKNAKALGTAINDTSKYYPTFFFTAEYNAPFHNGQPHNEVWFYASSGEPKPQL